MRKLLTAASLLALVASPAFATDPGSVANEILNGQLNLANSINTINVSVDNVDTTMDVSGVAIGNNLSAETWGNTRLINEQTFGADAFSTVNITAGNVGDSIDVTNAAMGNNASLTVYDAGSVDVINNQGTFAPVMRRVDPTAITNISLNFTDQLTSKTIATANNFSLKTNAPSIRLDSVQDNVAITRSITNIGAAAVGSIDVTGAAIGNNLSIGALDIE
jgi:hypothetical protein